MVNAKKERKGFCQRDRQAYKHSSGLALKAQHSYHHIHREVGRRAQQGESKEARGATVGSMPLYHAAGVGGVGSATAL